MKDENGNDIIVQEIINADGTRTIITERIDEFGNKVITKEIINKDGTKTIFTEKIDANGNKTIIEEKVDKKGKKITKIFFIWSQSRPIKRILPIIIRRKTHLKKLNRESSTNIE